MTQCKSCGAEIRWEKTEAGKNVPISVATGESHFRDCPQAKQWTKRPSPQRPEQRSSIAGGM